VKLSSTIHWKTSNAPGVRCFSERAYAEERVLADGTILALIDQTRAEWAAWAQSNFPTLTVAERTRMGVICWLLAVAIRRLMR
jgi:hypothetical protein